MTTASSKVFFLPIERMVSNTLVALFEAAGFSDIFKKDDLVAIKVHFGEPGNTAYLKADNVKPIFEKLKAIGTKPFLTDANTLYKGMRANAVDHINSAKLHGYDFAPVIIADGLNGKDYVKVKINGTHFKEVNIGSAAAHADSIMVMTHFKGHELTGFGGTLKNIGMGFGSRSGKQRMHADVRPEVDGTKCTGCGTCIKWCPAESIALKDKIAAIDRNKCIGCAECVVTCPTDSIEISWSGTPDSVQEKIAEYSLGAVKDKRCAYFSFINNVSPNCDCYNFNAPPIVRDVGVLASMDPVAIDQASLDLVEKTAGLDIIKKTWPNIDHSVQLEHAQKIGLGYRKYDLITL